MRHGPSLVSRAALCAALLVLNFNAAAPAATAPAGAVLSEAPAAVVDDAIITQHALETRVRRTAVMQGATQVSADSLRLLADRILQQMIDEKLERHELEKEMRERKIKTLILSDKELDGALLDIAQGYNLRSVDALLTEIRNISDGDVEDFKEQVRMELSWDQWIRGIYRTRLLISEAQIDAYEKTFAEDSRKTQYLVNEIVLEPSRITGGEAAILSSGADLVASMRRGESNFSSIATQFSSSPSAVNGGNLGSIVQGELPAPVDAALTQMKVGDISDPIRTPNGFYIIKLEAKREPSSEVLATLKQAQIALPAGSSAQAEQTARARLNQVRDRISGCSSVEDAARRVQDVSVSDLGETNLAELLPVFRDGVVNLSVGQASQPLRSEAGLHVLVVCGKRQGGEQAPTRAQIQELLFDEQLNLVKRRAIRDLRAQATILRSQ